MQEKNMICTVCPMGCRLTVTDDGQGNLTVTGNTCKRGETYAIQESTCPMRTLTSLVSVIGGEGPLCPVKTANVIPKAKIAEALCEVKAAHVEAPVKIGDVIISNIAGTGVDLIAAANRGRR